MYQQYKVHETCPLMACGNAPNSKFRYFFRHGPPVSTNKTDNDVIVYPTRRFEFKRPKPFPLSLERERGTIHRCTCFHFASNMFRTGTDCIFFHCTSLLGMEHLIVSSHRKVAVFVVLVVLVVFVLALADWSYSNE